MTNAALALTRARHANTDPDYWAPWTAPLYGTIVNGRYRRPQGWTYFVGSHDSRLIKIGCTTQEPEKRLAQLQIGSPLVLHIVACVPGVEMEPDLHRVLEPYRAHGEWFDPPPLIRTMLRAMASQVSGQIAREQREHKAL